MGILKKTLKLIAAFFIILFLGFLITLLYDVPSTLWEQHKEAKAQAEWDSYVNKTCWEYLDYPLSNTENFTEPEIKAFQLYGFIDDFTTPLKVDNTLLCCEALNYTCVEPRETDLLIEIAPNDWRIFDYNVSQETGFSYIATYKLESLEGEWQRIR